MKTPILLGTAGLALFTGLCVWAYQAGSELSGIQTQAPVAAGLPTSHVGPDGQALYSANCAGCHGARAQGSVGPKLAGRIKPWSDVQFAQAVLDGLAPEGRPLGPMMPHFKTTGFGGAPPTAAQITAVKHFIQGL